jgi:hypothetical protein
MGSLRVIGYQNVVVPELFVESMAEDAIDIGDQDAFVGGEIADLGEGVSYWRLHLKFKL